MTTKSTQRSYTTQELKDCARELNKQVLALRQEVGLDNDVPLAIYVNAAPIIESTLKRYRSDIEQQTNSTGLVAVNPDAGIPMPALQPQQEFTFANQHIWVAIERSDQKMTPS